MYICVSCTYIINKCNVQHTFTYILLTKYMYASCLANWAKCKTIKHAVGEHLTMSINHLSY